MSCIPVAAVEGNGGCAEAGLAGVTQAEVDGDRINRCTVELDLEDGGIAIFIGDDIISSDRYTGRKIIDGIQCEAGAAICCSAVAIADNKGERDLTVEVRCWSEGPGAIAVVGDGALA